MKRFKIRHTRFCRYKAFLLFFLFPFVFYISVANSQTISSDTLWVNKLLDSAYVLESIDGGKALKVYEEVISISNKIGYKKGAAKGYHYSGIVYSDKSDYKSAFLNYREALRLYKSIKYPRGIGGCHTNLGNLYAYLGKPDSAVINYQAAVAIFDEYQQLDALSQAYGNLGGIFQQIQQHKKSLHYFTKSVNLAKQLNDSSLLCRALINQGTAYNELNQVEKSVETQKTALKVAEAIEDDYAIQLAHFNIADYYKMKKDYSKAISHGLLSLKYALKLATPYDVAEIKKGIGDLYTEVGNYQKAKVFYQEAIKISEEIKAMEISSNIYNSLHKLYAKTGEYEEAYKYLLLTKQYDDSVFGEKQLKTINELEVRYQSLQKDKELTQNQLQLEKSKQYIVYSIGTALIGLLLALLIYFYYHYKRKIHVKQLNEVQQEKEIQVLQALMNGEEKERSRIARDLHDEVAGILAAAKMHVDSLARLNEQIVEDRSYKKVVGLLDEASVSVRKTAHNLMPEVLITHGLDTALRRYCFNISNENILTVQYDSWGEIGRCSANFELSVYRIVQELLNNVIKHSKANEAIVQANFQQDLLSITIEDNGVGFDSEKVFKNEGMGINSIKSRVQAINGRIDVSSEPGLGVSTYLEFEINKKMRP